jgi:hypothetical protein
MYTETQTAKNEFGNTKVPMVVFSNHGCHAYIFGFPTLQGNALIDA